MTRAEDLLATAVAARSPLRADEETSCYRLVNGAGDGIPDLTVDWFSGVAILSLYRDVAEKDLGRWREALEELVAPEAVYLKHRPRTARQAATRMDVLAPEQPLSGRPTPEHIARERGLSFLIRPAQGLSVGLYLDARDARRRVEEAARGARVLNLFAYTCGFGVAAQRGGAVRVVNVDLSRKALRWGAENAAQNGLAPAAATYRPGDAFEWLARLGRRQERFDVIVADPPAFSSSSGGVFSADRDWPRLAAACAAVAAPGARLFCLCNQASLKASVFEARVRQGLEQVGRRVERVERSGAPALDFPPPRGEEGALKVLSIEFAG